jgi:hypothetical protein
VPPVSPCTEKVRTAKDRQKPPDKQRTAIVRALTGFALDELPQCFPTL